MGTSVVRVVYTEKWAPALPFLYVYAGSILIGFLSPIVGAALDASGRPGIIARLAIGWTAINWAVVAVTTPIWGAMGFVAGFIVHVIVGNAAVVIVLRRIYPETRVVRPMLAAFPAAIATAALGYYVLAPWAISLPRFVLCVVACAATFLLTHGLVDPRGTRDLFHFARSGRGKMG
jgi:O-antigen/teichoic acid export membrane protein